MSTQTQAQPSVVNQLLIGAIQLGIAEAETYKPQILAAANAAGITAEKAVDMFIESLQVHGPVAVLVNALKPALIAEINKQIAAGISQDDVLFGLLISFAQNEVKRLGG